LDLVTDDEERDDFARLFLRASKESAKKSAFQAAAEYVDYGISVLSRRHWRDQYNLSLALYCSGAELAYCIGDHDKVSRLAAEVKKNAMSRGDQNRAVIAELTSHLGTGSTSTGIDMCLKVLKELKVPFQRDPGIGSIVMELLKVKMIIGKKGEEDILALPPLEDERIGSAMQVLYSLWRLYTSSNHTFGTVLAAFKMVRLTMRFGLSSLGENNRLTISELTL
jgi:predicted ATPase